MRLRGEPEEYFTAERAAKFRRDCKLAGVAPVIYIYNGRYTGDEYGMEIRPDMVAEWACEGLVALGVS